MMAKEIDHSEVRRFGFFRSFRDALEGFDPDSRLMFYEALMTYAFDGVEPDFDGDLALTMAWRLAKPNVDSSIKGHVSGGKGGRGNKAQPETTPETPSQTQGLTPSGEGEGTVDNPIVENPEPPLKGGLKPPVSTDMDMDGDREEEGECSQNTPTSDSSFVGTGLPDGWKINPAVRCNRCGSNVVRHSDGRECCPTCDPLAMLPKPPSLHCSLCGSVLERDAVGLTCPVCKEVVPEGKAVWR